MAQRTLLQIVQAACDELGNINRPTSVVSSQDAQVQQLLALMNREGKELSAREGLHGGWQQLRKEFLITTVIDQEEYAFPSDLQYFVNTTSWDRTNHSRLRGPLSPQEWQIIKSGVTGSIGPHRRFRIMDDEIVFDPAPEDDDLIFAIEYYSDTWCQSSMGVAQRLWAADNDTPVLPDDCFILGLMWRFRRAKGLDYAEEHKAYENLVSRLIGRAGMAPVIDFAEPESETNLLDEASIPATGFGSNWS